jgi:hypothetical protein
VILHIVNGGTVADGLRAAGVEGDVVEYADVLHEGPVPPDENAADFREVRAAFIAASGWAPAEQARLHISAWEGPATVLREFDDVVLWYEHDLFDQLLLIRLLSWWWKNAPVDPPSLVSPGDYLGLQTPAQLVALFEARECVEEAQLTLACDAWRAFTASEPLELARIVGHENTMALPHLEGALRRLLEEYPSVTNGLARTERQILEILEQSPLTPFDLFTANARREERVFMGDATFFMRLERMLAARRPLVRRDAHDAPIQITDNGRRVLSGELDDVAMNGIDKWIGGVHLTSDNVWRWNGDEVMRGDGGINR